MRVSLNWLKDYVGINLSVDELSHQLTMLGLEIEKVERPGAEISNVFVGKILSIEKHPDADKLVVCRTDIGCGEPLQIVCGAKNMKEGDLVPTAVVGATLPGGFQIARRKMRGIESHGMMCSSRELGLGESHDGLLILDPQIPVGKDVVELFGLDDAVFEIEVTPNRGDWASMIGVARELSALHDVPLHIPEVRIPETAQPASFLSSVTIEAPDLCPRYAGRVLTEVKIGPSPAWLCRKLEAAGQRPINNVVDITNFVLMETGHPLHAFDYERLSENRIIVRKARPSETIITIDGETRTLDTGMLVIADAQVPVAVAGIMGGRESEVGESTTSVFLESAYFDPKSVRKTSRALGLATEASQRFQRGADPDMVPYALDRAASLMQELAGAQVAQGQIDAYPKPLVPREVTLRYDRSDALLGTVISPEKQRKFLHNLGFEISKTDASACTVFVPLRRHDVKHESDLIEDIARLYGYESIPSRLPRIRAVEKVFAPHADRVRQLRSFLTGIGLAEFMSMTFSSIHAVQQSGLPDTSLDMVSLENPLSEQHSTMRSSLIPGILGAVSRNIRHGSHDIAAFEIGPVFIPEHAAELPSEPLRLALVLTGNAQLPHWSISNRNTDFFDIKGRIEAVLDWFRQPCEFAPCGDPPFETSEAAQVIGPKGPLGSAGRVRASIAERYDLTQAVYIAELSLGSLLASRPTQFSFQRPAAYPPSLRDLAVVVDETVPAAVVRVTAERAGGSLLKSVQIFDIYRGPSIQAGKKSIALGLVFQASDRTLTDNETQKTWDRILKTLEMECQASLR